MYAHIFMVHPVFWVCGPRPGALVASDCCFYYAFACKTKLIIKSKKILIDFEVLVDVLCRGAIDQIS